MHFSICQHFFQSFFKLFFDVKWVIAGDVLFQRSIGRTDLPGGDMNTLLKSIRQELFTLPNETIVFSGHGGQTSIGEEKIHNPFLK